MEEKSLRSAEWILIGTLFLIFLSLVAISQVHRFWASSEIAAHPETPLESIPVVIRGAVAKPGTYLAIPGTPLGTVFKKSRPKRFSNLRLLDLKQRVEAPLEIAVEELQEICVRVEGAVEAPQEVRLPIGARLCDLKSKVHLTDEADLTFFRKRRMLCDGECIAIPKRD